MSYRDGAYTGIAQGMSSAIRVTVSIADGVITTEEIWQNCETQSVGGFEAIKDGTYAAAIDAAQGWEIDTIAGATVTSNAVKAAVGLALDQARE